MSVNVKHKSMIVVEEQLHPFLTSVKERKWSVSRCIRLVPWGGVPGIH
jgi:hypothetical protein